MTLGTGLIVGGGGGVGHPTSGDEFHHYYRQDLAPTASDPLEVGDLWSDTTANLLKRCTSISPITFVSTEGGITGEKGFQLIVTDFTTSVSTGDAQFFFHIDDIFNGMNLVRVHGELITAGTTGTMDIQIANVTQGADMLSTKLTIDSGETGSDTAATPVVIDTSNDDVATNDLLRVDYDAVHTTPGKGLILTVIFQLP